MKESIQLKDVYTISEGMQRPEGQIAQSEGKNRWTKVGIGFVNRDNSINVILDAIPCNGRLHIRDRQPKEERLPARQAAARPMAASANR